MRTIASLVIAAVLVASWSGAARAEDPKTDALTIIPSTGASMAMAAKDKRGVIGFEQHTQSGFRFALQASAPLDEDTRVAAFLKQNSLVGGFNFNVHVEYDSTYKAVDLPDEQSGTESQELCEAVGKELDTCLFEKIESWGKKNPERPEWKEYQKKLKERHDREAKEKQDKRNEEAALRFMPKDNAVFSAFGADASISYDNLSIYRKNLSVAPSDVAQYELQGGGSATLYIHGQLALTLRAGGSVAKDPSPKKVERCTSVPSDDATITGRACKDVLFLAEDTTTDPVGSGYARFSATYVALEKVAGAVPGLEFRAGVEQLGQKPVLNLRFLGFFSPPLGPAAARFGVGIDLKDPLADDSANGVSRGHPVFTPFVFVGVTPTNLDKLVP